MKRINIFYLILPFKVWQHLCIIPAFWRLRQEDHGQPGKFYLKRIGRTSHIGHSMAAQENKSYFLSVPSTSYYDRISCSLSLFLAHQTVPKAHTDINTIPRMNEWYAGCSSIAYDATTCYTAADENTNSKSFKDNAQLALAESQITLSFTGEQLRRSFNSNITWQQKATVLGYLWLQVCL